MIIKLYEALRVHFETKFTTILQAVEEMNVEDL